MRTALDDRWPRISVAVLGLVVLVTAAAPGQTLAQTQPSNHATLGAAPHEPDDDCGSKTQVRDLITVFRFDPATGRLPEGIAISERGEIHLGVQPTGEVVRLEADGQFSILADLDQGNGFMLGLALDAQGNIYAALDSFDPATHGVWQIDRGGVARLVAAMPTDSLPNELAFDLDGNLYITDTFLGAVWKLSKSGGLDIWVASPLLEGTGDLFGVAAGANGLAFFPKEQKAEGRDREGSGSFYVSNTDRGTIIRIPVLANGSAGVPTVFAQHDSLVSADGIRFDIKGNLYVAVNLKNTLARVDRCGQVEIILLEGLDRPAGLAFGTSDGEKNLLYVTNFALGSGNHLVRVDVGIRGLPLPDQRNMPR